MTNTLDENLVSGNLNLYCFSCNCNREILYGTSEIKGTSVIIEFICSKCSREVEDYLDVECLSNWSIRKSWEEMNEDLLEKILMAFSEVGNLKDDLKDAFRQF